MPWLSATAGQLADRSGLPALDARTAYLGHSPPSVSQVLGALATPGPGGPGLALPQRINHDNDFIAHGVTFGLELSW